jgi:hypothetical protein
MQTVYNWVISQMDEKPQEGNLLDVVIAVHWRRNATLVFEDKTYFADTYGLFSCPTPSETDYTAYPNLTFEQVCGWLDAGMDVAAMDAKLDIEIEAQINPPVISLPLPWAPVPVPTTTTTEAPVTSTTTIA